MILIYHRVPKNSNEKVSTFKLKAIRRLTADDEQFIKQLSDILNKVFYKGSELEQMMENLNDFRKLAAKENILRGSEGKKGYNLPDNEFYLKSIIN